MGSVCNCFIGKVQLRWSETAPAKSCPLVYYLLKGILDSGSNLLFSSDYAGLQIRFFTSSLG